MRKKSRPVSAGRLFCVPTLVDVNEDARTVILAPVTMMMLVLDESVTRAVVIPIAVFVVGPSVMVIICEGDAARAESRNGNGAE